jgi:hypothetical protein
VTLTAWTGLSTGRWRVSSLSRSRRPGGGPARRRPGVRGNDRTQTLVGAIPPQTLTLVGVHPSIRAGRHPVRARRSANRVGSPCCRKRRHISGQDGREGR